MRVLTVDWDYFFPDTFPYDWGHDESRAFFLEQIWWLRAGNRSLTNPAGTAYEEMVPHPSHRKFWAGFSAPKSLIVTETHADAFEALWMRQNVELWNLDAHHDLGYSKDEPALDTRGMMVDPPVDCGNWAGRLVKFGGISSYHLVYPAWRKGRMECPAKVLRQKAGKAKLDVRYSAKGMPKEFDLIFLCRSGCWTPTWQDEAWMRLVYGAQKLCAEAHQTILPFAYGLRHPYKSEAANAAEEWGNIVRRAGGMSVGMIPLSAMPVTIPERSLK